MKDRLKLVFYLKHFSKIYPKRVLDVGTGVSSLPHIIRYCGSLVTSIDNFKDYWTDEAINRHFHVINEDINNPDTTKKFDLITCISVLEHIENAEKAVCNMFNLLNPKGYLILTFPYTENKYYANVYQENGSSYGQDLR